MSKFINMRGGRIHAISYRFVNCLETTLDDLITKAVAGSDDYLTAEFDIDELCAHPEASEFLNRYGVKYDSRRGGTEILFDFAGEKFAVTNNTVKVAWEEYSEEYWEEYWGE